MGQWSEKASSFTSKVNECNATLEEGISKVKEIYTKLDFDPNKEDSLAYNTDILAKDVERLITEKKTSNEEIAGKVFVKAQSLDQEEEEEAARLAAQQSNDESDSDTTVNDNEEA